MPLVKRIEVDMDQQIELRVSVSVGERYGYDKQEALSQVFTAPWFVIENIQVRDVAETLCKRAVDRYRITLYEKREKEIRDEESEDDDIHEGVEVEGHKLP